jgi:hypothetical protein
VDWFYVTASFQVGSLGERDDVRSGSLFHSPLLLNYAPIRVGCQAPVP